jgi:N-methylhydantoinase A
VIVPFAPAVFCALGMLMADIVKEGTKTVLLPCEDTSLNELNKEFQRLEETLFREFEEEKIEKEGVLVERRVEVRYKGQVYELSLPWRGSFEEVKRLFHNLWKRRYGNARWEHPIEIVNIGVRIIKHLKKPSFQKIEKQKGKPKPIGVYKGIKSYERKELGFGFKADGPLIILEDNATTFVPQGFCCQMDEIGNLLIKYENS